MSTRINVQTGAIQTDVVICYRRLFASVLPICSPMDGYSGVPRRTWSGNAEPDIDNIGFHLAQLINPHQFESHPVQTLQGRPTSSCYFCKRFMTRQAHIATIDQADHYICVGPGLIAYFVVLFFAVSTAMLVALSVGRRQNACQLFMDIPALSSSAFLPMLSHV